MEEPTYKTWMNIKMDLKEIGLEGENGFIWLRKGVEEGEDFFIN
jgi:hypothetical protein